MSSGCEIVAKVVRCSVAVKSVEFLVDGQSIGSDDSADEEGRFSFQWDTAATDVGEHTITAKATLANDQVTTGSDEVKVTISR